MFRTATGDNRLFDDTPPLFMSLSLGSINLLAQQSNIVSIESIKDIDYTNPLSSSVGWIYFENSAVPVYSFNDELEVEQSISINKSICAVLQCKDQIISLMCLEASPFKHKILKIQALPECMQATPCLFDSLCLHSMDNSSNIDLIVSDESLVKYFNKHDT